MNGLKGVASRMRLAILGSVQAEPKSWQNRSSGKIDHTASRVNSPFLSPACSSTVASFSIACTKEIHE